MNYEWTFMIRASGWRSPALLLKCDLNSCRIYYTFCNALAPPTFLFYLMWRLTYVPPPLMLISETRLTMHSDSGSSTFPKKNSLGIQRNFAQKIASNKLSHFFPVFCPRWTISFLVKDILLLLWNINDGYILQKIR